MYCVIEQNYNRNQRTSVKITTMTQCMQDIKVPSQIATDLSSLNNSGPLPNVSTTVVSVTIPRI